MSTKQDYNLTVDQETERRIREEFERKQEELRRIREEYERKQAILKQINNEINTTSNRINSVKKNVSENLLSQEKSIQNLFDANSKQSIQASNFENDLTEIRNQISEIRSNLSGMTSETINMRNSVDNDISSVIEAQNNAASNISETNKMGNQTINAIDQLGDSNIKAQELRNELMEKEKEIEQLEKEISFVVQKNQLNIPAMLTLMAMESNGYTLSDSISDSALTLYFDDKEKSHQIAVRHQAVVQNEENKKKWELEAETFQLTGEKCLDIIDDFETSVKDITPNIKRKSKQIYPKKDGASKIKVPPKSHMKNNSRSASQKRKELG